MSAVRPLESTPLGVAAVRATLAAAFETDPMMGWLFPDPVQALHATAAWLGVFVEAYAASGVVDVIDTTHHTPEDGEPPARDAHEPHDVATAGVALWRVSEASLPFSALPTVGGLLAAFVGAQRAGALGSGLRAFAEHKPEPPFHYLQFLAVHPGHQGTGLGRQLVLHGQQRAAASGVGVYLESTNPRNLPFYRSCGFEQIGSFTLLPAGPPAYRLWWQE
jgi:ribosomal protein S18 acetylase RimI-like enzyme